MADLPIGSIVMFDGAVLPVGWYDCDGAIHAGIQTPNLIGKFPKGVPAGGSLGETGGSPTHVHSNVNTGNASHGHPESSVSSGASDSPVGNIWAGTTAGLYTHYHMVTIAAIVNSVLHGHSMPDTDAVSSLPPNISLRFIMRCE